MLSVISLRQRLGTARKLLLHRLDADTHAMVAHASRRVAELDRLLSDSRVRVTVYGDGKRPLLPGCARASWAAMGYDDDRHFGPFTAALGRRLRALQAEWPGRVAFGCTGAQACELATARNVMVQPMGVAEWEGGAQPPGVFGIVVYPTTQDGQPAVPPERRLVLPAWLADSGAVLAEAAASEGAT